MTWREKYLRRYYNPETGWMNGTTEFWQLCERVVPRGARILEIGAGPTNPTSTFLASLGTLDAVDLDPAVHGNEAAERTMTLQDGVVPCPDGAYGACVSNFVLEHVEDPVQHLSEVRRVLKPGGVYVFRTPNRWHYVSLVAQVTPHWFHSLVSNRLRALPPGSPEPYPTFHRLNSREDILQGARRSLLEVEALRLIEKEPSYGLASRPLFLSMVAYERVVNSWGGLDGLRSSILGVLVKPAE